MQAIIDAIEAGRLHARIQAVISDQPDAAGLERAEAAGIPTCALPPSDYPDRQSFDHALAACVDRFRPRLIVLAGYMRILGKSFVERYAGQILNIHPSLLPKYRGLDTYARVLAAGDPEHGSSVHYVTAALDAGPLIMQARVPVLETDTEATLSARVKEWERRMYPEAIQLVAQGRLEMKDEVSYLDGRPLSSPLIAGSGS
jgi:phosphoribosylglycinamide formyltransferase-1